MKAYSLDLRQRIINAHNNRENSLRQLASRFNVSLNFVQKLIRRYQNEGTLDPKPHGGGSVAKLANHLSVVQQLVEEDNDATLAELCERIEQRTEIRVSQSTLFRVLQQLDLTRKKKHSMRLKQKLSGFKICAENTGN